MSDSGRRSTGVFALLVLGLAAGWAYTYLAARLGVPFAIPVGIVGVVSVAVALRGSLGLAIARHLGFRSEPPPPPDELTGQFLGELEDMRVRMQELEERVDFSERMLAGIPKEPGREQSRL